MTHHASGKSGGFIPRSLDSKGIIIYTSLEFSHGQFICLVNLATAELRHELRTECMQKYDKKWSDEMNLYIPMVSVLQLLLETLIWPSLAAWGESNFERLKKHMPLDRLLNVSSIFKDCTLQKALSNLNTFETQSCVGLGPLHFEKVKC